MKHTPKAPVPIERMIRFMSDADLKRILGNYYPDVTIEMCETFPIV